MILQEANKYEGKCVIRRCVEDDAFMDTSLFILLLGLTSIWGTLDIDVGT